MRLRHALVLALALLLGPAALAQEVIFPGLTGQALRDALAQAYRPSSVPSSDASKDTLYAVIDRVTVNGQAGVRGLYTDYFVPFDCNPNCDPSQDVYNGGSGINQEHVWPRSQGASGLAERDMHHLYPTRVKVNSDRGSLRFGESPDAQTNRWYYLDQERTAPPPEAERDAWSELRMNVLFEPREEKKGDVARAMFYFYTMYGPSGSGQASTSFFEQQKDVLFDWHRMDPPTEEERARSERVAQYQRTVSGRTAINPFAHDPTLAQRAYFPDAGPTVGPVVFVDASATGAADGASWATAFTDLQDALALARENPSVVEEIWVAAATYYPTTGTDRTASFELVSGVALYGGFAGGETSPAQRDWEANETILSGDIGVPDETADNSYHVVTAVAVAEGTRLDGFVIRDGNASEGQAAPDRNERGGGLWISGGALQVAHTVIRDNRAGGSSLSSRGYGAGAFIEGGTHTFKNVTFESNLVTGYNSSSGAGLYGQNATLNFRGVNFLANDAWTASQGLGATLSLQGSSLSYSGGIVRRNRAQDPVSGTFYFSGGEAHLANLQFQGNGHPVNGGPAIYAFSNVLVVNTTFVGNNGAVRCAASGNVTLSSVTAATDGDTINCHDALTVHNSILAGEASFVRPPSPGTDGEWGTEDDDYGDLRLQEGSAGIDAGDATLLPPDTFDLDGDGDTTEPLPLDLDGQPRVQGTEVDLGAYESPFAVASEPEAGLPLRDALAPAFPNPFRSQARLELALAEARAHVAVEAFDVLGRRVAVLHEGLLAAGRHALALDAAGLPAGVYLVRASGDGLDLAQRVTLLR